VNQLQTIGQQTVETMAQDRVGLAAADLHQGPGTRGGLAQFGGEAPHPLRPAEGLQQGAHRWVPRALPAGLVLIARTYWARSKAAGSGQRRWLMQPRKSCTEA